MELKYEIISTEELTRVERALLALSGKPFSFMQYDGVLKINAGLPHVDELVDLAVRLWAFPDVMDDVDDFTIIADIDKRVEALAGEQAAQALWDEWNRAAQKFREKKAAEFANQWIQQEFSVDALDATGIDSTFMDALYKAAQEKNIRPLYVVGLWAYNLGIASAT